MTSGAVEFLDGPEPPPAPPTPPARDRPSADLVAVIGWLVASGLAVAAPFLPVYTRPLPRRYADYLPGPGVALAGPDGWDRLGGLGVGVPLVVCAAVFAGLAGLGVLRLARLRGGRRAPGVTVDRLAVAAPCLLAGVVAVLALYSSAASGPDAVGWFAYAPLSGTSAYSSTLGVAGDTAPGWCLWLALAALVCGAAGTAAHLAGSRRGQRLAG